MREALSDSAAIRSTRSAAIALRMPSDREVLSRASNTYVSCAPAGGSGGMVTGFPASSFTQYPAGGVGTDRDLQIFLRPLSDKPYS